MLHRRYPDILLAQHRSSLRVSDMLCHCIDDGLSFQVDTLDFVTSVLWCGIEGDGEVKSSMKALPE